MNRAQLQSVFDHLQAHVTSLGVPPVDLDRRDLELLITMRLEEAEIAEVLRPGSPGRTESTKLYATAK